MTKANDAAAPHLSWLFGDLSHHLDECGGVVPLMCGDGGQKSATLPLVAVVLLLAGLSFFGATLATAERFTTAFLATESVEVGFVPDTFLAAVLLAVGFCAASFLAVGFFAAFLVEADFLDVACAAALVAMGASTQTQRH